MDTTHEFSVVSRMVGFYWDFQVIPVVYIYCRPPTKDGLMSGQLFTNTNNVKIKTSTKILDFKMKNGKINHV